MNWTAVAAVGEVAGAFGVIVSLIYLAAQVRANTRAEKASTYQALADASLQISLTLGSDPRVALTVTKGLAGVEVLSPAEAAQFQYLFHSLVRQLENGHFQYGNGTMDPEIWQGWTETIRGMIGSPGGRRMWASFRPRVRPSFADFIDREVLPTANEASTANYISAAPHSSPDS